MGDLLLTGAAGGVATQIRPLLLAKYGSLILSDHREVGELQQGESFRKCDLTNSQEIAEMLRGVDRVIHLGGKSIEGPWEVVLNSNIIGLYNFYEAARQAGVNRVVYASSVHAIGFQPRNKELTPDIRVRPDGRYGVSKVFGEALASLYADKFGLYSLSIRIGNIGPRPLDKRRLSIWLHPEDFVQLCGIGLSHPEIHAQIVWGVSATSRAWWDNSQAMDLGYEPAHNADDFATEILAADEPDDPVGGQLQGGSFCSEEFTGDLKKVLNQ